jgi:hypothetical protein
MVARPTARVIQEHIKRPLAEERLVGNWPTAGTFASKSCALNVFPRDDPFVSWR